LAHLDSGFGGVHASTRDLSIDFLMARWPAKSISPGNRAKQTSFLANLKSAFPGPKYRPEESIPGTRAGAIINPADVEVDTKSSKAWSAPSEVAARWADY
jgi:hypothetical protein